jgi:hypothetical protein
MIAMHREWKFVFKSCFKCILTLDRETFKPRCNTARVNRFQTEHLQM